MFTVHTVLRQGQEPDPLSPIVLVPFPVPVPVPVPVPRSVNKPKGCTLLLAKVRSDQLITKPLAPWTFWHLYRYVELKFGANAPCSSVINSLNTSELLCQNNLTLVTHWSPSLIRFRWTSETRKTWKNSKILVSVKGTFSIFDQLSCYQLSWMSAVTKSHLCYSHVSNFCCFW